MCRMLFIFAAEPTPAVEALVTAPMSLAKQSRRDRTGEHHLDGWGIGWYDAAGPRTVHGVLPACDDPKFAETAAAATSRIVIGHVRDASVGSVRAQNCHPFIHGPWMFCHNGTIEGFDRLRDSFDRETLPELAATRRGDTDSEHLFHWILSNLSREGFALASGGNGETVERVDVDGLYAIVRESLRRLLGWCAAVDVAAPTGLNLFLTDGRIATAVRHGRTLERRSTILSAGGATHEIASEPTDDVGPWSEVSDPSILTIDAHGHLLARPL